MGLDVHLKHSKNRVAALAAQDAAEKEVDALWEATGKRYEDYSEEEKDALRDRGREIRKSYGLDEWGSSQDIEDIEIFSENHPDHMFKIGYLRSSYNAGGINSVLKRAGCMDLYDIFEPGEDYYFQPDWQGCLQRARQAVTEYSAFLNSDAGQYQVIRVSDLKVGGARDEIHALNIFMDNIRGGSSFRSYSNRDGAFYLDGLNVRAVIRNDAEGWDRGGSYLIADKPSVEDGQEEWYLTALKITQEMIEYVLAQPDPENYFLSWSA